RETSSSRPAGPTKGLPLRSSSFPGCSPMNMICDRGRPSPKTVCVAFFQSGQLRHRLASRASSSVDFPERFDGGVPALGERRSKRSGILALGLAWMESQPHRGFAAFRGGRDTKRLTRTANFRIKTSRRIKSEQLTPPSTSPLEVLLALV